MSTQALEFTWITQVIHQLLNLLFSFLNTGDVVEGRFNLIFAHHFRFGLAERHRAAAATATALHLAHEEHEDSDNH